MKAILEFNLPEDQDDYRLHCAAREMYLALWDIGAWLRDQEKYHPDDEWPKLDKIRDRFYEILDTRNIDLDSL